MELYAFVFYYTTNCSKVLFLKWLQISTPQNWKNITHSLKDPAPQIEALDLILMWEALKVANTEVL